MKRASAIFGVIGALLLGYWLTVHIQEWLFHADAWIRISNGKHPNPPAASKDTLQAYPAPQW